jgi:glutamate--cysteine ligase
LGEKYKDAVKQISRRISNTDLTPSAVALNEMKNRNQGFFDYTNTLSKQHRREFLEKPIDSDHFNYLDQQTQASCVQQLEIERADNLSFDDYLSHYFTDE